MLIYYLGYRQKLWTI